MNILFFLTPKSDVAYIFENETLRQTLEKMEHRKFSCIPILNPDGKYVGTISEGDLLWGMKNLNITDMKTAEEVPVMAISRRATYKPVHVDCDMEDLLDRAINQNFVPVIDDQDHFIGIVTRKEIIKYCYKEMKKNAFNIAVAVTVAVAMIMVSLFSVSFSSIFYILICGALGVAVYLIGRCRERGDKK